MKELLSIEVNKAFRNRWFVIALLIGCALACWSAAISIDAQLTWQQGSDGVGWVTSDEWVGSTITGAYTDWMLVAGSDPFAAGLFFFIAPILVVMPYAWSMRTEMMDGYIIQQAARFDARKIYWCRYFAVFFTSGAVVAIPLILNFLVCLCFIPAYMPDITTNLYLGINAQELWARELFTMPLLYVVYNIVLDFLLCGLWGGLVLAVSLVVKNRVALIAGSFLLTAVMRVFNNSIFMLLGVHGFRFNFTDILFQGALTYYREGWPIIVLMLITVVLSITLFWMHKRDDVL